MTDKKFFFMAGLQRSGGTVLASILNQNPDIYTSPASPLLGMLVEGTKSYSSPQNMDFDRTPAIANALRGLANGFYADHEEPIIIDKNHWWTKPEGFESAYRYITKDVKFICPVRDITEILASFNTLFDKNPEENKNNVVDRSVLAETYPGKPMADRRADWLMKPNNDIAAHLYGMSFAKKPEFRHLFHFIEYNDIVSKPQEVLDELYDFLEIPKFNHSFVDLKCEIPRKSITGVFDLHLVQPTLERRSTPPGKIFLPETIRRYSGLEFWREL